MRRKTLYCGTFLLLSITFQTRAQDSLSITGFTKTSAAKQLQYEKQFVELLDSNTIGEHIKILSAKPHELGSKNGKANAEYILQQFKKYGWDAHIETYKVLFPTPVARSLQLISPISYKAGLKEPPVKGDAASAQEGQLPTYNAYSADGDVTGELVFVNYGLPEDYKTLDRMGVDVKGKIVIAKYGHSWRGTKPKVAYEHGAIGCIIYSDPFDDGYTRGDVYPKGAFKNENGVQRGSVMDIVIHPGDPLTPNAGATENAQRLNRQEAETILKIPVLPISYHDAQPLLEAMDGQVVPNGWAGSLPLTYHVGGGAAKVHLKLAFNWNMVTAYDVIAVMKGSEYPDEWIIRGNHHDAWVNGASDPISSLASLLEEAKAIGELRKNGYSPKRTLVYCAWDGEEPGLLGSTEWVEDHAAELQKKAVVYLNTDVSGRGFLSAGGSQALEPLITEVAKSVKDPQAGVSVFERRKAMKSINAATAKLKKEALDSHVLELGALGSGSDYSSFLQHLGIPVLDIGFGGENSGGEYHSIYDSYDNYIRFKDPGFHYGVALAATVGKTALRMADADVLPFDYRVLFKTIDGYVKDLMSKTDEMRESTAIENRIIHSNNYVLANDPTKPFAAPQAEEEVPFLNFSGLQNALKNMQAATDSLHAEWTQKLKSGSEIATFNTALYRAEQQLLSTEGLPSRPWYKHVIYAPGFYTGYGVKTMPGIREAIEQRKWKTAQEQINIAAETINKFAGYLQAQR